MGMQKNWLIRTKSNHILGPVSKEKVLELYHNGSIRQEDEICSGNGYWFYLREKEQVDRYLLGAQRQSFNPISEARDVLTADLNSVAGNPQPDDITLVSGISLSNLKDELPPVPPTATDPQKKNDLSPGEVNSSVAPPSEAPAAPTQKPVVTSSKPRQEAPIPTPVAPGKLKRGTTVVPPPRAPYVPKKRLISDQVLMYGAAVVLILLAVSLYYRKRILQNLIQSSVSIILPEAHAQSEESELKKKIFSHRSP